MNTEIDICQVAVKSSTCSIDLNTNRSLVHHRTSIRLYIQPPALPFLKTLTMERLSRRFSRYFSLSRRSTHTPSTSRKICKSNISKPIVSDERDTHSLLASAHQHSHSHSHSHASSAYTISDQDLRSIEDEQLSRRWEVDIDDILAQYQDSHTPTTAVASPFCTTEIRMQESASSSSPQPSSVYSSPPASPPTISAKLERFKDTPPAAPSWEKVSFGRQTRLFGPDKFMDFSGGGMGRVDLKGGGEKGWRGGFGRRGYAVL